MLAVKINGTEYEFPQGMNLFDACSQVGIFIPHFCYHPVLEAVGSCRMCKVEIIQNGRSRIDISCRVEVADGMEVVTSSPAVKKQQQMTLEFLLANHPLDCPICDDAGECELQNFYFEYGRHDSRMRELKVRKRKAYDVGPNVVLDSERCVLCSRCVRFLAEVTKTRELGIFGMGSTEELMIKPGARLDNNYAGNVVDLCPVGALTDKDFRFKRRVWYLKMTPSICNGCSRGCNVRIDADLDAYHSHKRNFIMRKYRTEATEYQRIQRIKPRVNDAVNGHWICDHGRFGFKATDSADRLLSAFMSNGDGLTQSPIESVVSTIASGLNSAIKNHPGKVSVIISPELTNEEVYAVWQLFHKRLNLPNIDHRIPIPSGWHSDDLLRTPDPFPNRLGCEWIGFVPGAGAVTVSSLADAINSGKVDTLLTVLADPREYLEEKQLRKLKRKYYILRNLPDDLKPWIDAALPAAAWGEYGGTFTNFQGRVQRLNAAFQPLGEAVPVWRWMIELSNAMKKSLRWNKLEDIQRSISDQVIYFRNMNLQETGPDGANVKIKI